MLGAFVTHGLPWQRWMDAVRTRKSPTHRTGHRWAQRLAVAAVLMGVAIGVASALSDLWTWGQAGLAAGFIALVGILVAFTPPRLPAWTSWAGCVLTVFLVLAIGQIAWLPDYHQRFGLRRQVELSAVHEQEDDLPIVSYPKRWDSIGFYTHRTDVESYTPAELAQLVHDLHMHGKALVFVRRAGSLPELLAALPDHLEVELLDRQDGYIAVGLVRPRKN
jgi:hypothetical protein